MVQEWRRTGNELLMEWPGQTKKKQMNIKPDDGKYVIHYKPCSEITANRLGNGLPLKNCQDLTIRKKM